MLHMLLSKVPEHVYDHPCLFYLLLDSVLLSCFLFFLLAGASSFSCFLMVIGFSLELKYLLTCSSQDSFQVDCN